MGKCEEKRDPFRRDTLAAWAHYQTTGLYATAEEADAWLARLEAGEEAALPTLTTRLDNSKTTGREHD
jgi:predicted transcriptional regulator